MKQLTALQWQEIPSEIQNVIENLGITLTDSDLSQLSKAIASYVASGNFYNDSGSENAYVLSPIGNKQALVSLIDGSFIRFRPDNNNTGASTINVAGLGVKILAREDGTALVAGEIESTRDTVISYDSCADVWHLIVDKIVATVQSTTSGTVKSFTNIPAWVKKITVILDGVSLSGTDDLIIQIGDSGGIESSGYVANSVRVDAFADTTAFTSLSDAFPIHGGVTGAKATGLFTLVKITGNTWISSHACRSENGASVFGGGNKILSGVLTQLDLTRNGSDTFDAGQVSIMYE